jgi:hypothetical protein
MDNIISVYPGLINIISPQTAAEDLVNKAAIKKEAIFLIYLLLAGCPYNLD